MKKFFLGNSPQSSLAGYILAGLVAIHELRQAGETDYITMFLAAGIAVLGRVAADDNKKTPST